MMLVAVRSRLLDDTPKLFNDVRVRFRIIGRREPRRDEIILADCGERRRERTSLSGRERLIELRPNRQRSSDPVLRERRSVFGLRELDELERLRITAVLIHPREDRRLIETVEGSDGDGLAVEIFGTLDRRVFCHDEQTVRYLRIVKRPWCNQRERNVAQMRGEKRRQARFADVVCSASDAGSDRCTAGG